MALIEMDFAMGGGEHYEETLLWENSSPSSAQSAVTLNLSDSIANYDYIKFVVRRYIEDADTTETLYTPANLRKSTGSGAWYACLMSYVSSSGTFCRRIKYTDDTTLETLLCGAIGVATTSTNTSIVVKVIGLKKVGGSSSEKEITSIDPQLTDIGNSAYTVPADGMVYVRVVNTSNNAPTLTLDGITQNAPTSVLIESKYQWIYAFYVKTEQVIQVTFGSGTGRATYLSLIRMR